MSELPKFPKWDDYRYKENAEVEYIKAFEKAEKEFVAYLQQAIKDVEREPVSDADIGYILALKEVLEAFRLEGG